MSTHRPWPLPAALGVAGGIALASQGPAPWLLLCLAALLAFALLQPQAKLSVAVVVLSVIAGAGRWQQFTDRPPVLPAGAAGQELQLHGVSDGQVLEVRQPFRASLWISPRGALPAGEVVLNGVPGPAAGRRNPGGFDFAAHLRARDIAGQVLVRELLHSEPPTSLRSRLRRALRHGLDDHAAALTEALTLGERSELSDLHDDFAAGGLAHLLALSGLHLGVLVSAASRLLRGSGPLRRPLVLLLLAGFLLTVGISASLLRAAIMAAAFVLAELSGTGRPDNWTRLGLAAFISLLWKPVWLFDLSFQLSYLCLAGILGAAVPLQQRLQEREPPRPVLFLLSGLLVSAAAQLPALSLTASVFGSVPLLAVFVNVLAVPLASLLVPLGLLAALAGLIAPTLAQLINLLTGPLAQLLISVARFSADLPAVPWGEVSTSGHWYWACFTLVVLLFAAGMLSWPRASRLSAAVLLAAFLTPASLPAAELIAFDVGQGDAFLLRFQRGPAVLVDAGGNAWSDYDPGARVVVPAVRALGLTALDLVIATHADADHIGGLPAVLDAVPVQALAIGAAEAERPLFRELLAAAQRNGVRVVQLTAGETVRLAELTLQVLNPGPVPTGEANEDSLAFNVFWHGQPVAVLPGEVSARTEAQLAFAPAGVLTVPHHGSRFSSSERLLRAVSGHTAIISVGPNNYGHPHPTVLDRLEQHGYEVLTTLADGAVRVSLQP